MGQAATTGLMIGQGAGNAYSQYQSGRANARIDNFNAQVADLQAQDAIQRGAQQTNRIRDAARGMEGTQRAGFAAQGVAVDSGSAAATTGDTEQMSEMDALTARTNAIREAWGYRIQGQDARTRGSIARSEGNQRAIGTLLTTGADVARYDWPRT